MSKPDLLVNVCTVSILTMEPEVRHHSKGCGSYSHDKLALYRAVSLQRLNHKPRDKVLSSGAPRIALEVGTQNLASLTDA